MQTRRAALMLVVAAALVAGPAIAKTHHHRGANPCASINRELAAGKTQAQVSKELKVSASQVKRCAAQKTAKADRAPKPK
jgi:hypothetical protein